MREALRRAVEERREELVGLTRALVRVPTVNPPGENYREACALVAERLAGQGFATEFVRGEGTPGDSDRYPRWNLVARREGARPGPCVHFNGHVDVVEVGQGWTTDPFGGALIDGRVYGRGSCDMKGGLAAAMVAVEAFLALAPDFAGAIEISATADEETGGYGGVAHLARLGYFDRVDHVIIPEPLNKDRVCLGHRGRLVGRARDLRADRARLDAVPRRLRGAAYGRGDRRDGGEPVSGARRQADGDAGGAGGGAGLDASTSTRCTAARPSRRPTSPAGPRRWCPTAAGW